MSKSANRLLSHLTNTSIESSPDGGNIFGHRSIKRQKSNAVYIYRHPLSGTSSSEDNWSQSLTKELESVTGNKLRPVGSIIRRSSNSSRRRCKSPSLRTDLPSNPPSPPIDPTLKQQRKDSAIARPINFRTSVPTISIDDGNEYQQERNDEIIPFMDNKSTTAATADELMQMLMEDDGTDRPIIFTVFEAANIDGVKHLSSKSRCTRYTWFVLIILFICLCFYQIGAQAMMYWLTPVATNIIAIYPEFIPFPVVAICNNNQHRLTWITSENIQQRQERKEDSFISHNFFEQLNYSDVFDKALLHSWDMDAGNFLQNSAHQRARMIVRCELPNGSRCSSRDFRPVWTLTGLCWAINIDPINTINVNGAGPGNALRLLVNIERYERIESCTPKLRSRFLPGLKILIYNQTDVPTHYLEGVNIPAGFTMDIPFWMRQRQKLPGRDCVVTKLNDINKNDKENGENNSQNKEKDCLMRSYLSEIERRCNCSMREAYLQKNDDLSTKFSQCNVLQYFDCVQSVLEWARNMGFSNFQHCPIPCESIDYTAWQDMNELPNNILPKLISDLNIDEDDENESNEKEEIEKMKQKEKFNGNQLPIESNERENERSHYQCTHNKLISNSNVRRIKQEAQLAFEKQSKYQEDIQLRTKHLIEKFKKSIGRIVEMQWGWKNEDFLGVNKRFKQMIGCYAEIPLIHSDIYSSIINLKPQGEEERANQMLQLLENVLLNNSENNSSNKHYQTIGEVKRVYGLKADGKYKEIEMMEELLKNIRRLFIEETFTERLPNSIERIMGKIINLMKQFEEGSLRRKEWAERMNARNMRHFFDEDFYENWYNLIVKDLENGVIGTIQKIENLIPELYSNTENGTAMMAGSTILFGNSNFTNQEHLAAFMDDLLECIFNDLKNTSVQILEEFKRSMHELSSSQNLLFLKELPEYLSNFDFGQKFVHDNFAQVNVFLHKMHIEHWRQEPTYSIWSFFCDIGATMSLFLGASMLTIIEVIYFVLSSSRIYKTIAVWRQHKFTEQQTNLKKTKIINKKKIINPEENV